MIDTDIIVATVTPSSPFDCLPPDFGDPGPTDLDRLAASLDYLTLCCAKLAPDEPGQQPAAEAMAEHKHSSLPPRLLLASSSRARRRSGMSRDDVNGATEGPGQRKAPLGSPTPG